ncbi:MAG TPA: GGDEF domain-containing protein [Marinagarivorans sp.]
MITSKHLSYTRLAIGFLSLLIIAVTVWSPERKLPIEPDAYTSPSIYADNGHKNSQARGNSSAHWLADTPKSFACQIRDGAPYKSCGMTLTFVNKPMMQYTDDPSTFVRQLDAVAYRNFESIKGFELNLSYQGTADRLRVYLRNSKNRDVAIGNEETQKFISVEIKRAETNKPVFLQLHEFHVPNWWIDTHAKSRLEGQPEFNNVYQIGIDMLYNAPNGTHIFAINSINVVSEWLPKSLAYAIIIAMWIGAFALEACSRVYQLYSDNRRYHQSLKTLETRYRELQDDANKDPLTKVYNRRGLDHIIDIIFNAQKKRLCIAVLDIDYFKQVNDNYGHGVGDTILEEVALRIETQITDDDIFGRWGGEEFLLLCPNNHLEQTLALAQRIRHCIADHPFATSEGDLDVTISIGCAQVRHQEDFSHAFGRADQALYNAKAQGRNAVCRAK